MAIILIVFLSIYLDKQIKKIDKSLHSSVIMCILIYTIGMLAYNIFLEKVCNWNYGIPGMDMKMYFDVASGKASADYRIQSEISGIGYSFYVLFVRLMLYFPKIIDVHINLYLLYYAQILIVMLCILNFLYYLKVEFKEANTHVMFFILAYCVSFHFVASRLLRDAIIMYLVSLFFVIMINKNRYRHFIGLALIIFLFILRSYSVIITVPLMIYYVDCHKFDFKKVAIALSIVIFIIFMCYGDKLIAYMPTEQLAAGFLTEEKDYSVGITGIVKYLFFPNVISQTKKIIDTVDYNKYLGGFLPIIYYLLSVWNVFVVPLAIIGLTSLFGKDRKKYLFFLAQLIIIISFYALVYGGVSEPRHKLFILFPLTIFAEYGFSCLKYFYYKVLYIFVILGFLCVPFII